MKPDTASILFVASVCVIVFAFGFIFGQIANQRRMRKHFREMAEQEVRYVHQCWAKWLALCYPNTPMPPLILKRREDGKP